MSPDEIRRTIAHHYPFLVAEPRTNPYGWAFYLGAPRKGGTSNRIIRATRSSPTAITRLKLAVSSRQRDETEFAFEGDEAALRKFVDEELQLFGMHCAR
jgi:hypothetical protein